MQVGKTQSARGIESKSGEGGGGGRRRMMVNDKLPGIVAKRELP